jgi:hypothetical protein
MFSFANVPLPLPGPDVLSRIHRHLDYRWLRLWDEPWNWTPPRSLPVRAWDPWPVRNPQALPARPWLSEGPLRINTLLWPSGASRWGVFHALVDDAAMDRIRGATGSFGQPLTIDDGTGPVLSVTMYPLPPRPLSQIPGANGLQLLTLLDRRAYWPWLAADIDVVGGTTTWAGLFAAIATALGITLAVDDVPAAYLSPPAALSGAYDSLPALLDAACLSCGLRFAAALDGTSYRCWSVAAAQAQVARNLSAANPRVAGGIFLQGTDLNGVLPAAVRVVFPRADDGTPSPVPSVGLVTLASLNLPSNPPGGPPIGGIGGLTKTFHSSAVATFASGSATNALALAALATQAATDFYAWQAAGVHDVAFAGVAPWLPTGADGSCEYAHDPDRGAGGGILSRFRRDTYFDQQEALWHHTVTPCAAIPTRVRVVGTTLTDSCLYAAELVVRSGCADVAVSPPVAAWLRIDGVTDPPDAGDVYLASPEGVRVTDDLPVYVTTGRAGGGGGVTLYRATYNPDGTFNSYLAFTSPLSPLSVVATDLEVICQNGLNVDLRTHGPFVRPAVGIVEASASGPGVVSVGTQTFAGDKTFTGAVSTASLATGAITCSSVTATAPGTGTFVTIDLHDTSVGGTLGWTSAQWAGAVAGQIVAGFYAGGGGPSANSKINFTTYHVTAAGPGVTVLTSLSLDEDGLVLAGGVGLYSYRIGAFAGAYGTDPLGNVFKGGICTTVGGSGATFVNSVTATSPLGNTGTTSDPVIGIVSSTGTGAVVQANGPTLTNADVTMTAGAVPAVLLTGVIDGGTF